MTIMPENLSAFFTRLAPALANHLWQSTLCLAIAATLTLLLRKNHAQARYGLWLAASVKFLVPLSLLIALGAHMAQPRAVTTTDWEVFLTMREVGQPFAPAARAITLISRTYTPSPYTGLREAATQALPSVLAAIWFCGFIAVLGVWWRRWRRVARSVESAKPLCEGREVEALGRVERLANVSQPIELRLSPASLEPGIFGILRPVLSWPAGISAHLDDAHLEAVLAHEVWHVRRRDNLAAAVHVLVEALFWFHPLVWWLGARLIEERERACDEAVLALGGEAQVYAESILKTCQFCLESPLACVSGITGAELKQRIVRIMTRGAAGKLSLSKKLLLTIAGAAVVAGPTIFGLLNAPQIRAQAVQAASGAAPSFEVASIKLNHSVGRASSVGFPANGFTATNITTKMLIALAYSVDRFNVWPQDEWLSGGPAWLSSDRYDVQAKVDDATVQKLHALGKDARPDYMKSMIRSLLAERFNLKVSHEVRDLPVYALVVAKAGPKFSPSTVPSEQGDHVMTSRGLIECTGMPTAAFAAALSRELHRKVIDQTGLTGKYDFTLRWTPDQGSVDTPTRPDGSNPETDTSTSSEGSGPSIFTAVQEQLGLKLESTKGPVEIIVIDHIERPSEN